MKIHRLIVFASVCLMQSSAWSNECSEGAQFFNKAAGVKWVTGIINSGVDGTAANIGPRRLGAEEELGKIQKGTHRVFLGYKPNNSRAKLTLRKTGNKSRAIVSVCRHFPDGRSSLLEQHTFEANAPVGAAWEYAIGGIPEEAFVSVKINSTNLIRDFSYAIQWQDSPLRVDQRPVTGSADLHLHQFIDRAFNGLYLVGDHTGPQSVALRPDTLQQRIMGHISQAFINVSGNSKEGEIKLGHGFPDFEQWPHHNDLMHQKAHADWLRQAHEKGLNLTVVAMTNNQYICTIQSLLWDRVEKFPPGVADQILNGQLDAQGIVNLVNNARFPDKTIEAVTGSCGDMNSIEAQLTAARQFDEDHNWYEIASDPWDARRIIHEGKLAVVLAVEASHIFPAYRGDFIDQLDRFRERGVRSLQIVHETDNQFAGAAPHRPMFKAMQFFKHPGRGGFKTETTPDGRPINAHGLETKGTELLTAMMRRHMLIDTAHMSEKAVSGVFALATTNNTNHPYPFYNSHTRFASLLNEEDATTLGEFVTRDEQIDYYNRVGGMVGLRTSPVAMKGYTLGQRDNPPIPLIRNGCHGSTDSFAQMFMYGYVHGVTMAYGTDMSGFNQIGPRFGNDDPCPSGISPNPQFFREPAVHTASSDFQTKGLAHIGLLPDVAKDMKDYGVPHTELFEKSAEAFLTMWEKNYSAEIPAQ